MNLDLFDNIDGLLIRERENYLEDTEKIIRPDNNSISSRFPENTPLAMAYVPYQQWGDVYDDDKALTQGTLFPELDLPFKGGSRL
ncbi:MAG: spore coat associated protein CotJA [Ruminococcus sp.]|nr:spore coat associated protein CotJA [Ruminococcus sp.]HRR77944.1 spore coat associated protein CotJA [Ruminococcus sp.]